jgi:uncharacterized membrane protein YfcA
MTAAVLFTLVACAGMLVQSFAGFAGSLFAIPLFALFMSPREAVPAYNIVMIVIDLMLVVESRHHIGWGRVGRMCAGGVVGIPFGAYCLAHLPVGSLKLGISIVTLVFGVLFMAKIRLAMREDLRTQLGVGLLSGFMGGAISESGPPVVLMGLSCGWSKDVFRGTLLAYFGILSLCATASYTFLGMIGWSTLKLSATAIVPVLLTSLLGVVLKNRVPETIFRKAVLAVVIIVGLIGIANYWIES